MLNFRIQEEFIDIFPESDFVITADFKDLNKEDSTISINLVEQPFYVEDVRMDTSSVRVIYAR